jgi:hypothetical protein
MTTPSASTSNLELGLEPQADDASKKALAPSICQCVRFALIISVKVALGWQLFPLTGVSP